jgi:hypothetical protein
MAKGSTSSNSVANKKAKARSRAKSRHGRGSGQPRGLHAGWKAFRERIEQGHGSGE